MQSQLETRQDVQTLKENLKTAGISLRCVDTVAQALDYLDQKLDHTTVGIGGSMTVKEMGVYPRLSAHNQVFWHWEGGSHADAAKAEAYLSSVNAIACTGEIVNIDGSCNRIASMVYGHKRVYLIAGINKLAGNYDAALWRARNVAAPKNAQRLGRKTPCAAQGDRCYHCSSPERICRAMSVIWQRPGEVEEMEVLLIDANLGF